jgi:hypothetical protein
MRLKFIISPFDVSSSVEVSSTRGAEFKTQPSLRDLFTGFEDTDLALEVLEQLWRYMDGMDERSWDCV